MASADQYLRVVEFLLDEKVEGRELLRLEETAAFIAMEDSTLAIVIHPTKRGPELLDALSHQLSLNPKVHHKLVMVGGREDMRPLLEACQPGVFSRRMVQVYHLADDGDVWSGRASRLDSSVGRALEAARSGERSIDPESIAKRVRTPTKAEVERVEEHRNFLEAYRGVRPSVTIGAAALILGVFGLQMTWGGGSFLPTIYRMGANTPESLGPEPWRLLASTLLHGDVMHIAMNALVLYVLGAHLERILGWRRHLVLLVVAGLAGAVASASRPDAVLSVGASGAIWGLLGAALGIALRPGELVPAGVVKNLKIAALANLAINLSVSFMPNVDLLAHLGGGLAGAALAFSGVLTRGLMPLARDPARRRGSGKPWTLAAWGSGVLTVMSLALACVIGRPWELGRAPETVQVDLDGTRFSVRATSADVEIRDDRGVTVYSIGNPYEEPFSTMVWVRPWRDAGPIDAALVERWRNREPALDEGAELVDRSQVEDDGTVAYDEVHRYPDIGTLYLRYTMHADAEVTVSTFVYDGARASVQTAARAASKSLIVDP